MEKFLELVYMNQIGHDEKKGDKYEEVFEPMLQKLKETLSQQLFDEIQELFIDCAVDCCKLYAVEGMKLAIGIIDGSYVPTM